MKIVMALHVGRGCLRDWKTSPLPPFLHFLFLLLF